MINSDSTDLQQQLHQLQSTPTTMIPDQHHQQHPGVPGLTGSSGTSGGGSSGLTSPTSGSTSGSGTVPGYGIGGGGFGNGNCSRNYFCQRCLNHGLQIPRKSHKCAFRNPYHSLECQECRLVDERRLLNQGIQGIEREKKGPSADAGTGGTGPGTSTRDNEDEDDESQIIDVEGDGEPECESDPSESVGTRLNKVRNPRCTKCKIHGIDEPLKGHKRKCPYDNESHSRECNPCSLVGQRRRVMSSQVWLRRKQQATRSVPFPPVPHNRYMYQHPHHHNHHHPYAHPHGRHHHHHHHNKTIPPPMDPYAALHFAQFQRPPMTHPPPQQQQQQQQPFQAQNPALISGHALPGPFMSTTTTLTGSPLNACSGPGPFSRHPVGFHPSAQPVLPLPFQHSTPGGPVMACLAPNISTMSMQQPQPLKQRVTTEHQYQDLEQPPRQQQQQQQQQPLHHEQTVQCEPESSNVLQKGQGQIKDVSKESSQPNNDCKTLNLYDSHVPPTTQDVTPECDALKDGARVASGTSVGIGTNKSQTIPSKVTNTIRSCETSTAAIEAGQSDKESDNIVIDTVRSETVSNVTENLSRGSAASSGTIDDLGLVDNFKESASKHQSPTLSHRHQSSSPKSVPQQSAQMLKLGCKRQIQDESSKNPISDLETISTAPMPPKCRRQSLSISSAAFPDCSARFTSVEGQGPQLLTRPRSDPLPMTRNLSYGSYVTQSSSYGRGDYKPDSDDSSNQSYGSSTVDYSTNLATLNSSAVIPQLEIDTSYVNTAPAYFDTAISSSANNKSQSSDTEANIVLPPQSTLVSAMSAVAPYISRQKLSVQKGQQSIESHDVINMEPLKNIQPSTWNRVYLDEPTKYSASTAKNDHVDVYPQITSVVSSKSGDRLSSLDILASVASKEDTDSTNMPVVPKETQSSNAFSPVKLADNPHIPSQEISSRSSADELLLTSLTRPEIVANDYTAMEKSPSTASDIECDSFATSTGYRQRCLSDHSQEHMTQQPWMDTNSCPETPPWKVKPAASDSITRKKNDDTVIAAANNILNIINPVETNNDLACSSKLRQVNFRSDSDDSGDNVPLMEFNNKNGNNNSNNNNNNNNKSSLDLTDTNQLRAPIPVYPQNRGVAWSLPASMLSSPTACSFPVTPYNHSPLPQAESQIRLDSWQLGQVLERLASEKSSVRNSRIPNEQYIPRLNVNHSSSIGSLNSGADANQIQAATPSSVQQSAFIGQTAITNKLFGIDPALINPVTPHNASHREPFQRHQCRENQFGAANVPVETMVSPMGSHSYNLAPDVAGPSRNPTATEIQSQLLGLQQLLGSPQQGQPHCANGVPTTAAGTNVQQQLLLLRSLIDAHLSASFSEGPNSSQPGRISQQNLQSAISVLLDGLRNNMDSTSLTQNNNNLPLMNQAPPATMKQFGPDFPGASTRVLSNRDLSGQQLMNTCNPTQSYQQLVANLGVDRLEASLGGLPTAESARGLPTSDSRFRRSSNDSALISPTHLAIQRHMLNSTGIQQSVGALIPLTHVRNQLKPLTHSGQSMNAALRSIVSVGQIEQMPSLGSNSAYVSYRSDSVCHSEAYRLGTKSNIMDTGPSDQQGDVVRPIPRVAMTRPHELPSLSMACVPSVTTSTSISNISPKGEHSVFMTLPSTTIPPTPRDTIANSSMLNVRHNNESSIETTGSDWTLGISVADSIGLPPCGSASSRSLQQFSVDHINSGESRNKP